MIERPTTLLLGAGASHAYGLPLGKDLSHFLFEFTAKGQSLRELLEDAGFQRSLIEDFRDSFLHSQRASIDDFLARRSEFAEVGKAAIAAIIREYEDPKLLVRPRDGDDHWYKYLWNLMAPSWEELEGNKLSVVTFNYDRSLEEFLVRTMAATFKKTSEECWGKLKRFLRVVHVYGSVQGTYGRHPSSTTAYAGLEGFELREVAQGIRVIPEGRDDDQCLKEAQQMLESAERIAILGFGFDRINMQRLDAERTVGALRVDGNTQRRVRVVASVLGLFPREAQRKYKMCGLRSAMSLGPE